MMSISEISDQYLLLFANCFPVRGFQRSMICDVQNREAFFIDNSYHDLLIEFERSKVEDIFAQIEEESQQEFLKFVSYLIDRNLGMLVSDPSLFPKMSSDWHHPSKITNAIVDMRSKFHDFGKIFRELDELGCHYLEVRCFEEIGIEKILELVELGSNTKLRSIHFILKYTDEAFNDALSIFAKNNLFISFTIHSSPEELNLKSRLANVRYTQQIIQSCNDCGIINMGVLQIPGLKGFIENINFNGCLNKKISIDENGYIKNCPSMRSDFGNIRDTSLKSALNNEELTKLWSINKDQIAVCQDCEYRYICTDCRAFTDENKLYSKPSKCSYDPYSGIWAN